MGWGCGGSLVAMRMSALPHMAEPPAAAAAGFGRQRGLTLGVISSKAGPNESILF